MKFDQAGVDQLNGFRFALYITLTFLTAGSGCAQSLKPCLAYLLRGDVSTVCEGKHHQVTHRGDIREFAISQERSTLGYVTITSRGPGRIESVVTLIDLKSGSSRSAAGESLINTCGSLFLTLDTLAGLSRNKDLVSGETVNVSPYVWFRCSSDRKFVVGASGEDADLYEGLPPETKVAASGSFYFRTFNISPDGSKVVYFTDLRPLCVFSASRGNQCADRSVTVPDSPSVNDSGEVAVATTTAQECFYKNGSNFGPERFRGATEESREPCVGIGYWRPGLQSIEIIELIGRNPQWISPATVAMLADWATRTPAGSRRSPLIDPKNVNAYNRARMLITSWA